MINPASLRNEAAKRRASKAQTPAGILPASIPYLQGVLEEDLSLDERHLVWAMLISETTRTGDVALQIRFLRQQLTALPLQPILLANLASGLAMDSASHDEALRVGREAVGLAQKEDRQLRYCLTSLARIAIGMGDYAVLEEALQGLLADRESKRAEDADYEFDFLSHIDRNRVSSKLLSDYSKLQAIRS